MVYSKDVWVCGIGFSVGVVHVFFVSDIVVVVGVLFVVLMLIVIRFRIGFASVVRVGSVPEVVV